MINMQATQPQFGHGERSFAGPVRSRLEERLIEMAPLFAQPVASPELLTEWVQKLSVDNLYNDEFLIEVSSAVKRLSGETENLPKALIDILA